MTIRQAQIKAGEDQVIADLQAKGLITGTGTARPPEGLIAKPVVQSTTGNEIDPRGVNHPVGYNAHPSGVEAIEAVRYMPFNIGSAWKYMQRLGLKIEPGLTREQTMLKDLDKVLWYLKDEVVHGEPFSALGVRGLKNATAVINGERSLLTSQFYTSLALYCTNQDKENLGYAQDYVQAIRGRLR